MAAVTVVEIAEMANKQLLEAGYDNCFFDYEGSFHLKLEEGGKEPEDEMILALSKLINAANTVESTLPVLSKEPYQIANAELALCGYSGCFFDYNGELCLLKGEELAEDGVLVRLSNMINTESIKKKITYFKEREQLSSISSK